MQIVYADALTLLNRAGDKGFEAAAKQLRDTLRARSPDVAILRVGDKKDGDQRALARLADALGVEVIETTKQEAVRFASGLAKSAPENGSLHLISDEPLLSGLTNRPQIQWHSPGGLVAIMDTEAQCKAIGIPLEQWTLAAAASANPWVNLRQAAEWVANHHDAQGILAADLSSAGATGRRFKMYADQFKSDWEVLSNSAEIDLNRYKWKKPRTEEDRLRVKETYKSLGLLHWLDSAPHPNEEIVDVDGLSYVLDVLSGQTLLGLDISFGPEKKPRQVLLSQNSPKKCWTVDIESSALGDIMEEKLAEWLRSPRQTGRVITSDFMKMSPWFREKGVPLSIVRQDKRLMERYMEAQEMLGLPIENAKGSLIEDSVCLGRRLNQYDKQALGWIKGIELPLSNLLYEMHDVGFSIDLEKLSELEKSAELASKEGDQSALNLLKHSLYPLKSHIRNGEVHTFFDQFSGRNNRISTSRPQLQNLPKSDWGKRLRACLVPGVENHVILSFDYSQIEIVVLAHLSGDEKLLDAFRRGIDIHQYTAAEVFDVPLADVTSKQRTFAKQINFGLIYGKTAFGLSKTLGISQDSAKSYIDRYFRRMTGARDYLDRVHQSAKDDGQVKTLFGRKIRIVDADSADRATSNRALRQASNAPMQGSAAEIVKRAMLNCRNWLIDEGIDGYLCNQVHDELVFSVHKDDLGLAVSGITKCMLDAAPFKLGLKLDIKSGPSYGELGPYDPASRTCKNQAPSP